MEEKIVLFLLMIESDVTVGGAWHFNVQFSLQLSVSGERRTWHGWSPSTRPSTLTRSRQLKLKVSMKRVGWVVTKISTQIWGADLGASRDDSPRVPSLVNWWQDLSEWCGLPWPGTPWWRDTRPASHLRPQSQTVSLSVSSTCHTSTVVSLLKCC